MTRHLLGTLHLPSGRLAVADPMMYLGHPADGAVTVTVGAGDFPVYVDIVDVAAPGTPPHLRNRRLSVLLTGTGDVAWDTVGDTVGPTATTTSYGGIAVDTGMAGFVDADAATTGVPADEQERDDLFDSWWSVSEASSPAPRTCADIPLPLADGENVIYCMSGWGDGSYEVTGSMDAAGTLLAVHVDFGVEPLA